MKKRDYILHYSISLVLCFALVSVTYNHETPCEHKSILTGIDTLKTAILGEIDTIEINKALMDKIDELTRLKERLEMENAAQKDYINGFEDKFWKE
jgi:hypothetical protein